MKEVYCKQSGALLEIRMDESSSMQIQSDERWILQLLKQLNGEILNWGPTLLGLTSTGAYHTKPLPLRTHPISESNWVESLTGGEALIGEFVDKDQHPYLMVVNRDYNNPASFTLVLRKPVPGVSMLSRETAQWQAIEGYDQATGTFSLQLSAGNAELLRLNDADRR